jgi:uncharacterized membrane protein
MMEDERWNGLPFDLLMVVVLVALTFVFTVVPVARESFLRVIFGTLFVLVAPGYAIVAALFPAASPGPDEEPPDEWPTIDGLERVALSFGTGLAAVAIVGIALRVTVGIVTWSLLVVLGSITLACVVIANRRRSRLSEDRRFTVPVEEWKRQWRSELFDTDRLLNLLVVLVVLLAASTVALAVSVPIERESYTELYVLNETENRTLTAMEYRTELVAGENYTQTVSVANYENRPMNYTLLVVLQPSDGGSGRTRALDGELLRRDRIRLDDDESERYRITVRPTTTGRNLRLRYLLYRGSLPSEPTVEDAYRRAELRGNVTDGR